MASGRALSYGKRPRFHLWRVAALLILASLPLMIGGSERTRFSASKTTCAKRRRRDERVSCIWETTELVRCMKLGKRGTREMHEAGATFGRDVPRVAARAADEVRGGDCLAAQATG